MSKAKNDQNRADMQRLFGTNDPARACEIFLQEQEKSGRTEFFKKVEQGAIIQDAVPVVYTNQPRNQREEEAEEARQAEWAKTHVVYAIDPITGKHNTAKDDGCCIVMTALNLPTNIDLFLTLEQEKQFNQASFAISNELSLETTNMLNEFARHPIISGSIMSAPSMDVIMVPAVLDQFTLEDLGQFIGKIHNYLTGSATET
jgi:tRNA nucleotidyltransferase (CCA-adding enzyme)